MLATILLLASVTLADDSPTFERDVRPILAKRCVICHQAKKLEKPELSGGLALDSFEAVLRGSTEHRVVTPGKPAESPLFRRLSDPDEDLRMPLLEEALSPGDRDKIGRWIEAGAKRGEPTGAKTNEDRSTSARRATATRDVAIPVEPPGKPADSALIKVGPLPAITALAFAPDGSVLAVGTNGRVVLWDLAARRPVATLDAPGSVHALTFARDGRRLAIGSGLPARSGSVRVVSVPDGTTLHDFVGHTDAVYALAFRPDGGQLASAGFDSTVRLWNLADGSPAGTYSGHSDFVYNVAYSPDGQAILSASKDRSIKRFDTSTLKGLRTYSDHAEDVLALAAKPDGSGFVTAGEEPQIRWWRPDSDRPTRRMSGHSGPVFALAFSGDGKTLISASGDKTVRLWDGSSGAPRRTLAGATEWQYAAALTRDGRTAAAGGWDGLTRVWDAQSGKLLMTLLQPPGGWLCITPSAEATGSPDVLALVRWKSGGASR